MLDDKNDRPLSTSNPRVPTQSHHGGIILCGGKSSRMGRSKADLPFGDEVMLHRVTRLLSTVVRHIVVVAAVEQPIPTFGADVQCPVTVARDDLQFAGPLAGMDIGLRTLHTIVTTDLKGSTNTELDADSFAYVTSCDVPFLAPNFVQELFRAGEELVNKSQEQHCNVASDSNHANVEYDIVLPFDEKHLHPLSAAYRLRLTDSVHQLVTSGERRPRALFDLVPTNRIPTQELNLVDPGLGTLLNLNSPQEYQDALLRAGFAVPEWVTAELSDNEDMVP